MRHIVLFTLLFSMMSPVLACAPNCALVAQCDALQVQALALRDREKPKSFCRIQHINAAIRIGEACEAISENRLGYSKDVLLIAHTFTRLADRANCKDDTALLIQEITNFVNSY